MLNLRSTTGIIEMTPPRRCYDCHTEIVVDIPSSSRRQTHSFRPSRIPNGIMNKPTVEETEAFSLLPANCTKCPNIFQISSDMPV